MKITALLIDSATTKRLESHDIHTPVAGLRTEDITKARDLLLERAKRLGLRPVPGWHFSNGEVRVWVTHPIL